MKKSLMIALAFALVLIVYGFSTSGWNHVLYISAGLGLVCAGNALFLFVDRWILGDKGGFLTNRERRVRRSHEAIQLLIAAGVLFIPAMLGFILG